MKVYVKGLNGKWLIQAKKDVILDAGWQPIIKLKTGKILDPFGYLHEGLFLYGGEYFIPMIDLRPNNEFITEKRNRYYSN